MRNDSYWSFERSVARRNRALLRGFTFESEVVRLQPPVTVVAPTKIDWRKEFRDYKKRVWAITNAQNLQGLSNYDKRGFNGWHVEHRFSIWAGYKRGIAVEIIGSIVNLEMAPKAYNMKKGRGCSITEAELITAYDEHR